MRVVLIRHGQTEWNLQKRLQGWHDSPLTSDAITQLYNMDLPILRDPIVYSSDLGRALDSAKIISEKLGAEVVVDSRLRERKFGRLEGKVIDHDDSMQFYWRRYQRRYTEKLNDLFDAEPEQVFEDRIASVIGDLHHYQSKSDVVLVGHGEWLRAFVNVMNGTPSWHEGKGICENAKPIIVKWPSLIIENV